MPTFARVLNATQAAARMLRDGAETSPILTAASHKTGDRTAQGENAARQQAEAAMQQIQFYPLALGGEEMSMPVQYNHFSWYNSAIMNTSPRQMSRLQGFDAGQTAVAVAERVVDQPSRDMLKREGVTVRNPDLTDPRKRLAHDAEALLGYGVLRTEVKSPGRLLTALAKLEIEILDQDSVNKYKAQMVEHYRTANKMSAPTWRLRDLRGYKQPVPEFALSKAVEIKRELPEAVFYVDQLAVDPFLIVSLGNLPDPAYNQQSRYLDAETAAYIEVWDEPKFEAQM